jgi:hypothetical protein
LAYLLDPHAAHEQGPDFLQSFLNEFLSSHSFAFPIAEETFVHTEFVTSFGCLDIAIFLPSGGRICIENKVWATEQEQQIGRYQGYLASLNPTCSAVVYMSPNGHVPRTIDTRCDVSVVSVSYKRIATWLTSTLPGLPARLKSTVGMYAHLCSEIAEQGEKHAYDIRE